MSDMGLGEDGSDSVRAGEDEDASVGNKTWAMVAKADMATYRW